MDIAETIKQYVGAGFLAWLLYRLVWLITGWFGLDVIPVSQNIDVAVFAVGFFALFVSDIWKWARKTG